MNGCGSAIGVPSIVTRASSIASSSAACVLGGVRLISSASTTLALIGPGRTLKVALCGLKTVVPTTSDGIKSGVN